MKRILYFFLLLASPAAAQHYGDMWYFGNHAGIDFRNCIPVIADSSANTGFEGCATICNASGQALFYTNSDYVWNRQHQLMPNGSILSSSGTLSQVLIIPRPGSFTQYYIFTTQIQGSGTLRLQYHTVDMSLDNGFGDVLNSNNVLDTTIITEQVCATYHINNSDIWVMTHDYMSNAFKAWLVTSSGVSATPVISNTGPAHHICGSNINARGEIKFSPDRSMLAFNANGIGPDDSTNILLLCDFDNSSGMVSNPIELPYMRGDFGLTFSPDNSKLYGSTWKAFAFTANDYNYIYQFDLSSGNPATIAASRTVIDSVPLTTGSFGSMKIGPDGKVYVARYGVQHLGVINAPNNAGASCNYQPNGFFLAANCGFGLNNYIEYQNYCAVKSSIDETVPFAFQVFPNPAQEQFSIQTEETGTMMLFDMNGKLLRSEKISNPGTETFSLRNFPPGIYQLCFRTDDGRSGSMKLAVMP